MTQSLLLDTVLILMISELSFLLYRQKWFYPRGQGNCQRIENLAADNEDIQHLTAEHVVFAFQIPLPRDKVALDYR